MILFVFFPPGIFLHRADQGVVISRLKENQVFGRMSLGFPDGVIHVILPGDLLKAFQVFVRYVHVADALVLSDQGLDALFPVMHYITVLLAEDITVNAEIMIMVLSMREIQTDHAENGRIAVEMFEEHEDGYYDAVLMDMRMPEMDGLEATRRIRAMNRIDAKTIPIIALTANAFDEDVQQSMQAGLNAHLSKPVDPDVLFETLEGLLNH